MRFYGVSKEELDSLQTALGILGRIYEEDAFSPFLYVLVEDGEVLEAVAEGVGKRPTSVAVAIPVGEDTLHFLLGSGIYLEEEDAAYTTPGEGSRLVELGSKARLYFNEITAMALSSDSTWLGEFLESHAPKPPMEIKEEKDQVSPEAVKRTEPVEAQKKSSSVPGLTRILISGKDPKNLPVTEQIEVGDFVSDHCSNEDVYLRARYKGMEWLIYTDDPDQGQPALTKLLKQKYGIVVRVILISGERAAALAETWVDEQLG
jgi:hypothetical protein